MEEKIDIKAKTIKVDTGKGNTIKVTMSYGEQSTLEELLIAYLGQMIIPELSEPPVRTLGATIPENESHIFR